MIRSFICVISALLLFTLIPDKAAGNPFGEEAVITPQTEVSAPTEISSDSVREQVVPSISSDAQTVSASDQVLSTVSSGTQTDSASEQVASSTSSASSNLPFSDLTPEQLKIANMLKSIFENESKQMKYDYAKNLKDGRGITLGRDGYCTGTGDAVLVVQKYINDPRGNKNLQASLRKYEAALVKLAKAESDSEEGLNGFAAAWKAAAKDPVFCESQDAVSNELYYNPAMKVAADIGAQLPLTKVALYEASIQHGMGQDEDSLGAIVKRATARSGGTPSTGVDEKVWLKNFFEERKADLMNPSDKKTAKEWGESVGRADAMLSIYDSGNFNLDQPITINPFGKEFTIP
ncbi:MAG: chitosanase [Candidatus Riflebacteria bacterium]|nr:chitosanase [Candidatus Riflebacteria bacterium]